MENSDNIYKVKQNERKQICIKISLFCGVKYLEELSLISQAETEKVDESTEIISSNYKAVSEKLYCHACNVNFETVQDMRQHQWTYKHRLNKGWIKPKNSSSEDDENEDSDIESVDEEVEVSDDNVSEDECDGKANEIVEIEKSENIGAGMNFLSKLKSKTITFHEACTFPTIYFQNSNNNIIGIKRCILFNKKNKPESQRELLKCVSALSEVKKCAVLMYSGGSFSGAIFEGNKQILNKTFKRYTYRRQQGGSQATKDGQGRAPKSAGAFLRRVNFQKLNEDIYDLLHDKWAKSMSECGLILVWSAKNQRTIFCQGGKLSFDISNDPRVRFISARVAKVNSTALLDVYKQISTIEVYDAESIDLFVHNDEPKAEDHPDSVLPSTDAAKKDKKKSKKKNKKEKMLKESPAEVTNMDFEDSKVENDIVAVVKLETKEDVEIRNRMLNYVLNDSAEDLIPYLNDLKVSKSCEEISSLLSAPLKAKNQSLLHIAVCHDNNNVISPLLQLGCDPTHRNNEDETPYALAIRQRNKTACNIMSTYMYENPTQYDYFAAKFPGGKDPLKELEKKKKEVEKKKQYRKDRKERQKQEEEEKKKEAVEKCKRDQFLSLDDSSKLGFIKKIQYDQRRSFMLCFQCAGDISNIVPFCYRDFSFCGMDCLKRHRVSKEP